MKIPKWYKGPSFVLETGWIDVKTGEKIKDHKVWLCGYTYDNIPIIQDVDETTNIPYSEAQALDGPNGGWKILKPIQKKKLRKKK